MLERVILKLEISGINMSQFSVFRLIMKLKRLDLVVVDQKRRTCKIIDFAVPRDSGIEEKEKEKIE